MLLDDFDSWATTQPDAAAVCAEDNAVTYGELRRRALEIARALARHGVASGDRVVVYMPKSIDAIARVFGVLYAGAAYVPIDPRAPAPRVAQIIDACAPRAVIGHAPYLRRLVESAPQLLAAGITLLTDQQDSPGAQLLDAEAMAESAAPNPRVSPASAAYLLFTSGSTGVPKGVVVSHLAASSFVAWARKTFALSPDDHLTSFAPLSFDLSVFDIFGALGSGARVNLVAAELLLRPKELVRRLAAWHTSTLYAVPSTVSLLERDGELASTALPHLRQVLYAGEPFAIPALRAAMLALPNARFYNLFGPTETNVCTYHPISAPPEPGDVQVPIGRACEHLRVDLLDESGKSVAVGEEGELCVAGASVMTEYFGDPVATAAAFHPGDAFADGERRYRTGDRALMDAEGRFWFRGRRDRLVKRRGYRVELGDIEAALRKHPRVREACAIAQIEGTETRIAAYVELEPGGTLSSLILRAHCGSLLPPYMVPDSVQIIAELPRTLTGKLDLQLLRNRELAS